MASASNTTSPTSAVPSAEVEACALRVKSPSLTFANGIELFDDINFSVADGERVGIIGRNGALRKRNPEGHHG